MAAGAWQGDVTIYALCDPDSLAVRYVGKANDMRSRIRQHRWEAKSSKLHTRKVNWLRSLKGREPVIMILAVVKHEEWEKSERYWITEMRNRGCALTNYADGGQTSPVEGKGHTLETKQKMREVCLKNGSRPPSRKGIPNSDEAKKKNRETHLRLGTKPPAVGGWNKGIGRTHCRNGHEYTTKNTKIYFHKKRNRQFQVCRICEHARLLAFNSKKTN